MPGNRNFVYYSRFNGKGSDSRFWVHLTGATEVNGWWEMIDATAKACAADNVKIGGINLYAHGAGWGFYVGTDEISGKVVNMYGGSLRRLQPHMAPGAVFTMDVCALAHKEALLKALATKSGIPIRAYRDLQTSNILVPVGEGPSKVFRPDGHVVTDGGPWKDADGNPIIRGHFAIPGGWSIEISP